jgi:hypothetical protein
MASVLDFERYSPDLQRQLLRRIGYTNGLHKIRRFSRVVEYLYSIMPTSVPMLAEVIIREENKRLIGSERPLKGKKYATGIIDVAGALGLTEKFGPRVALSSEGYACHALNCANDFARDKAIEAFLLERLIDADGEYLLNILRIVSEGTTDVLEIGKSLVKRFFALIDFKQHWVKERIQNRYAKNIIEDLLIEARRKLEQAINDVRPRRQTSRAITSYLRSVGDSSSVQFFFRHTVSPRIEWLEDLQCIEERGSTLSVTQKGVNLLSELRRSGAWREFGVSLPLNSWLSKQLELPNLYDVENDFAWRLVAAGHNSNSPADKTFRDSAHLLQDIKVIYPTVKLANFNEADVLSIYLVFAAREAIKGRVLSEDEFTRTLEGLVENFPSEIFKLSKRRGRGMYIALKHS